MTTAGEMHRRMHAFPFVKLPALLHGRPPLVLAPHPDDESLGCGGLIASACETGMPPIVVVVTDGSFSHPGSVQFNARARAELRANEARAAVRCLGLAQDRLFFLGLRDGAAPSDGPAFDAAAFRVADLSRRYGCGSIYTTWHHDPHPDHQAANRLAAEAARRTGMRQIMYPIWGWMLPDDAELGDEAPDGVRLDVSRQLPAKRAAIAAHASQHGRVITDDPRAPGLPAAFLAKFDLPYEVFLTTSEPGP